MSKTIKANIGTKISVDVNNSLKVGAFKFWSIIFSNPSPKEDHINIWGTKPNNEPKNNFLL